MMPMSVLPPPCPGLERLTASGLSSLAHAHPSPGKQYWEYEFQQQPSREECEDSSVSAVFEHFAMMQLAGWEDIFEVLFGSRPSGMERGQVLCPLQEGWDPRRQREGWDPRRAGMARVGSDGRPACRAIDRKLFVQARLCICFDLLGEGLPPPGPHTLDFA